MAIDAAPPNDLPHTSSDVMLLIFKSMPLNDRLTCTLVCKAWAEAAGAATRQIALKPPLQDLGCLQKWLEKHGNDLEALELHQFRKAAPLTALPCAQLQSLLLCGKSFFGKEGKRGCTLSTTSQVWSDVASATKLTSVLLRSVHTASQQADVVSALTALSELQQLTWNSILCSGEQQLSDSRLLQRLTKLTALEVYDVSAEALQHLGSLTKLQHLSIERAKEWAAAGCPGLQELQALTKFQLFDVDDALPSIHQLTALQHLELAAAATPTALIELQALTGLTLLCVQVKGLSLDTAPLQLPGLQHLRLMCPYGDMQQMPVSFLAGCTGLRVLSVDGLTLSGPGSLVISPVLQDLVFGWCSISSHVVGAAGPMSWRHVFPCPGQLPHLTSLQLQLGRPALQQADIECVVDCCSNLQRFKLSDWTDPFASALMRLPALTSLDVNLVNDRQCRLLAQLTGLRELAVYQFTGPSDAGVRALTALKQLTRLAIGNFKYSQAPAGCPPDVSSWLKQACDKAVVKQRQTYMFVVLAAAAACYLVVWTLNNLHHLLAHHDATSSLDDYELDAIMHGFTPDSLQPGTAPQAFSDWLQSGRITRYQLSHLKYVEA